MAFEEHGSNAADSGLTAVTSNATGGVKGSWVELVASTTNANELITVQLQSNSSGSGSEFSIDIATGAASSETVVIADIPFFFKSNAGNSATSITFPLTIASGTRISARCSDGVGSNVVDVGVLLNTDSTFGTNSAITNICNKVQVAPSLNTKSSWVELNSSTAATYNWLLVGFTTSGDTAHTASRFLIDIGTGAASSEVVLIPNMSWAMNQAEAHQSFWVPAPTSLSSGTRLAARAAASSTSEEAFVSIYGANVSVGGGGGGQGISQGIHSIGAQV